MSYLSRRLEPVLFISTRVSNEVDGRIGIGSSSLLSLSRLQYCWILHSSFLSLRPFVPMSSVDPADPNGSMLRAVVYALFSSAVVLSFGWVRLRLLKTLQ